MTDTTQTSNPTPAAKVATWWSANSKAERYARHFIATTVWAYAFCQLFVFDLDHYLIENSPEPVQLLVRFKFLVLLAVGALVLTFVSRQRFWSWLSYIALYPLTRIGLALVVMGYVIFRLKSWPLLFTLLNVLFSFIGSFKFNFVVGAAAFVSIATVLISNDPTALIAGIAVLLLCICAMVFRRFVFIFRPTPVFDLYAKVISWLTTTIGRQSLPDLRGRDLALLSPADREKKLQNLSTAIVCSEACGFLEAKFREYRTSGMPVAFYLLNFFLLLMVVIWMMGFVTYGLYHAYPTTYAVHGSHDYFDFLYYSFAAMFFQQVSSISPADTAAKLIWMFQTLLAAVFGGMLLSLFFAVKKNLDDAGIQRAISKLEQERVAMGQFVQEEYALRFDDAVATLERLEAGLYSFVRFLRRAQGL